MKASEFSSSYHHQALSEPTISSTTYVVLIWSLRVDWALTANNLSIDTFVSVMDDTQSVLQRDRTCPVSCLNPCNYNDQKSYTSQPLVTLIDIMPMGYTAHSVVYIIIHQRWGTADTEITVPAGGSPGLSKVPSFY